MKIILIGPTAVGKTTVGEQLAEQLGLRFYDLDAQIEKRAEDNTVAEIFAKQGEEAFRTMETATLQELLQNKDNYVLAPGAGVVIKERNRKLLQAQTDVHIVYLSAPPFTLLSRAQTSPQCRPMLEGADPLQKLKLMQQERDGYYLALSHIEISTINVEVRCVVEEIERHLVTKPVLTS